MDQKSKVIVWSSCRTLLMATAVTAATFLFCSFLLWRTDLPERYGSFYALICCCIGSAAAGFGGGKTMEKRGIVWGICYGIMFLLLLMVLIFLVTGGTQFPVLFRPHWVICIAVSAVSGMLSVNLRKE